MYMHVYVLSVVVHLPEALKKLQLVMTNSTILV